MYFLQYHHACFPFISLLLIFQPILHSDGAGAAGWRSVLEMHALNAVSCALFFTYCAVSCVKQPQYPRVINYVNNISSGK